jgi:DNA modification methylase
MKFKIIHDDAYRAIDALEQHSIDCCFTSPNPPFYSVNGIGSGKKLIDYVTNLAKIFEKIRGVLKDRGSLLVHMGDYHDNNTGNMLMIPEKFAIAMQDAGWILRSKLVWHRPDDSPQHDFTRFKRDWEHVFFFTKQLDHYFKLGYEYTSVFNFPYIEPQIGRFESGFPKKLIEICLQSACPPYGIVLDPFCGSGTTGVVALENKRTFIGIELKAENIIKIRKRLAMCCS